MYVMIKLHVLVEIIKFLCFFQRQIKISSRFLYKEGKMRFEKVIIGWRKVI